MSDILYVGSSYLDLAKLEHNHRNASTMVDWNRRPYSMTYFRTQLLKKHNNKGSFRWLAKPELRTLREVEELEKNLINKYLPNYNLDYDPVASSEAKDRYQNDSKRYRGVYCFEDS